MLFGNIQFCSNRRFTYLFTTFWNSRKPWFIRASEFFKKIFTRNGFYAILSTVRGFFPKNEEKCLEYKVYFTFHWNARIQRDLEDSGLPFRYTAKAQMLERLEPLSSSAPRLVKRRRRGRFSWRLGNFCPGLQPCRYRQRILWLLWKRKFSLPLLLLSYLQKAYRDFERES